jgi:hypothetical protein
MNGDIPIIIPYTNYKIGHLASVPKFLISMHDLEPSLLCELAGLDNEDRNFVLKQGVGRMFEDINSRLWSIDSGFFDKSG